MRETNMNDDIVGGCSCGVQFYGEVDYEHVCIDHPYADDPWYAGNPPADAIDRGDPAELCKRIGEYVWRNSNYIKTDFDWAGWNLALDLLRGAETRAFSNTHRAETLTEVSGEAVTPMTPDSCQPLAATHIPTARKEDGR